MAASRRGFLVVLAFLLASSTTSPAAEARATAVFVFGDSTADVGNNNFLPGNGPKVNFPHYGVDFPGGVPTGRFSNGYNGVDFVAQMLGFKQSPPPYLSIKSPAEFFHGASYASGGSGVLDITGQNVTVSLNAQIEYFSKTVEAIKSFTGEEHAGEFLSRAVFMLLTGNNDMFGFYALAPKPLNETQKEQFVSLLAATLKGQLQRVHELGARKIAVIGTTLLGCIPRVRALFPDHACAEDLNDLSRRYNLAVKAVLADLSTELEGMQYSFTNSYRVVENIIANPQHFGYTELKSACCGGGVLNAVTGCMPNATFCSDRTEFLFWDGVHPTQATYRLVAKHAYRGSPLYATPVNIQKLAAN